MYDCALKVICLSFLRKLLLLNKVCVYGMKGKGREKGKEGEEE